jgi:hypothetical protein
MANIKLSADSKEFVEQINLANEAVKSLVESVTQLNEELQKTSVITKISGKELLDIIENIKNRS